MRNISFLIALQYYFIFRLPYTKLVAQDFDKVQEMREC